MSEFQAATGGSTRLIAIIVIAIVVVAGVTVVLLGGFINPPTTTTTTITTTTTSGPTTLTILTRHDTSIHNVFEPAFLASEFAVSHQITDVIWKTPSAEFWDDLIDLGQVDVCWGGGPTLFDQLNRDNRLAPLNSSLMLEVAARVPDTIAGANMKRNNTHGDTVWIAAAISSFGFTVNHAFLDEYGLPVPHTWTDLANVTYGSLLPATPTIAMGNAPDTTSNTRIYEIITQGFGWDEGWITMARMAGSSNIYGGSVETQSAVETGQVGIAMSIDFYGFQTQYRNSACEYIVPEGQTIVNGDPIAISATTSKEELAEGFVDFVLSGPGQVLWLNPSIRRMPVMREAFDEPGAAGAQDLYASYNQTIATTGIDFNDTLSLETNAALINYWESVFTDAHTELVNCWAKIVEAYEGAYIDLSEVNYYAGLMGLPVTVQDPDTSLNEKFTLEYAKSINNNMIYDATFAAAIQNLWTNAAKSQYIAVMNQVIALMP